MYRGKYEAPKGTVKPKRAAATRRIEDVPFMAPESREQAGSIAVKTAPVKPEAAASAPTKNIAPKQAAQSKAPAKKEAAPEAREKKLRKRITGGTIAFYTIYLLVIACFFMVLAGAISALDAWLVDYEGSQPKYKCQEVFDQYFANPDWGVLYDMVGLEDTAYEGKAEFVQFMQELYGQEKMRYVATASGDPNRVCKYILKAGEHHLGTFTLVTGEHSEYEITQWELGEVALRPIKRELDVAVTAGAGQTVYINGKPLGSNDIVRTTLTLAEEYLPEGVHGHSSTTYYLDGLLVKPQVEVKDAAGNLVTTTYDEAENLYTAAFDKASFTMSDSEKTTLIAAAKVLSEFRIEAKTETALARYFDTTSAYYKATVKQDTWMQDYKKYSFSEPVISEYYRYSDTFFSAHVEMTLSVTRMNGSVKDYNAGGTFFLTKRSDGKWMVTDANNIKLQQEVTKVRLQYMLDDQEITRELVDSSTVQLEPPYVTVPEGKVFAGWFYETVDEQGNPMLALAFKPDESTGLVYLGTGAELEPMVLHARFEDKGAQ